MCSRTRSIAIAEARGVINVSGSEGVPRKRKLPAKVQSIALLMVQVTEAGRWRVTRRDKPAGDATESLRQLIGIGEIKLGPVVDVRGMQGKFPAVDARALNGNGEKKIGVVQAVVIEKITGAG